MLTDKLREGATGPVAKIIFLLIIISFLIGGISLYLSPKISFDPVKVNGQTIPNYQLDQNFRQQRQRLERQFGRQLNDLEASQLRTQTLEKMINDQVLLDHTHNVGILVADALVAEQIAKMPEFQIDGKFDQKQYSEVLSRANYTPQSFGEALRTELASSIYRDTMVKNEFALPYELSRDAKMLAEERTFKKIDIDVETFAKEVKVDDKEVAAYYEAHKNDFLLPQEIKISYVYLKASDLEKDVVYTEEDLEKYFNLHTELFVVPEKRKVAHILLTGEDAEQKIKDVEKELKAGAKFADLAMKYSEDPASKDKGGVLPAFSLGNMDASFEKAAFALQNINDVSEPVSSQYGWHLIQLLDIEKQYQQNFADEAVHKNVIEHYVKDQSKELFGDKRQVLIDVSYDNPDNLDAAILAANAMKAPADKPSTSIVQKESKFFAPTADNLEYPLSDENVKNNILKSINDVLATMKSANDTPADQVEAEFLKLVNNSDVIDLSPTTLFVYHIDGYKKPDAKKLADVKSEIVTILARNKAVEASKATVAEVVQTLEKGEDINKFVLAKKIKVGAEQVYSRMTNSNDYEITSKLFAMQKAPEGKASIKSFEDNNGDPFILVLTKVHVPEITQDDRRDSFLTMQVSNINMEKDTVLLVQQSRQEADIDYNTDPAYLKQIANNHDDF